MAIRPLHICYSFHRAVCANWPVALAIGLLTVVGIGGLVLWVDGVRYRFLPKNFGTVEEGLIYRSGQIHGAIIEDVLVDHHIQTVIDLSGDSGRSHEDAELAVVDHLGIEKLTLAGLDGHGLGPIESYAQAFCRLVKERQAGRPVLVHCRAGSQRTGALIALYRVLVQGWTPDQAYAEYLRYRRRPPSSNDLFDHLNKHMARFLELVVEDGALPAVPETLPVLGASRRA